jgi:hypothetical protein
MAYRFMAENRGRYAIREMAANIVRILFGVSGGAYYKWAKNGVSQRRSREDAELLRLIREIVLKHHRRYGSPRVREELRRDYGKRASLKKVARLMRENGLNARRRRKFIPTTNSNQETYGFSLPMCENLLDRQFHAEKGGQKWVSGITYLRTADGWVYLTVVLDLFDRKVIGWALSADMDSTHTTIAALKMAFKNRTAQNVLESSVARVRLASSRHPVIVEITAGKSEGTWKLHFSDNLDIPELKRNLNKPLFPSEHSTEIEDRGSPPDEISPWDRQTLAVVLGRAAELGIALPDTPAKKYEDKIAAFLRENPAERGTEREQLVRQRIGQDLYREALMQYWKGSCAVTTIDIPQILKASHARPWKDCDADSDRLNVYNGFLLSANLDSLFDSGLISFTDQGDIIYSSSISVSQILIVGLPKNGRLRWIDQRHLPYLTWHREKVFKK